MLRRTHRITALALLGVLALASCRHDDGRPTGSGSAAPSGSPSLSSSPSPSASPSASRSPSRSASPSASRSPSPSPSPSRTVAGTPLSTAGAYLEVSEDPNLTTPDPENGCEVHDPDLANVSCDVVRMAGGTATWVVGDERHNLPGQDEPRKVVRIYRRYNAGTDEMAYVGFGEPGQWAEVAVRTASLTGQTRDTLVVIVTFRGSGTLRGYDLVTWRSGRPMTLAAHHPDEGKARVFVRAAYIAFYGADYSDGAPNCCPNWFSHDRVRWDGTRFRREQLSRVRTSSVPSS